MNNEMKSKIQEHINEACRDHMVCYEDWLYDGFVENNEMSKFDTRADLVEAFDQDAIRNVGWVAHNVDCSTTEPIIEDTIEWAKENLDVELDWNDIEDYDFLICDVGEWDETICGVRKWVVAKWVESHAPLTAREIAKVFKDISEDEFYGDIWIAKKVDEDYTKVKDVSDLFEASLFGYGIRFVESDEDGDMVIWLCKMKKTNITTNVIGTMAKSVFKEVA